MLVKYFEDQIIRKKATESQNTLPHSNVVSSQVDMIPQISVRDPQVLNATKGRPKGATRNKSPLEEPKKRTCSYCHEKGHYISSCPKKKVIRKIHWVLMIHDFLIVVFLCVTGR